MQYNSWWKGPQAEKDKEAQLEEYASAEQIHGLVWKQYEYVDHSARKDTIILRRENQRDNNAHLAHWHEYGEKVPNAFLTWKKRNHAKKPMQKLYVNNSLSIYSTVILPEQKGFQIMPRLLCWI